MHSAINSFSVTSKKILGESGWKGAFWEGVRTNCNFETVKARPNWQPVVYKLRVQGALLDPNEEAKLFEKHCGALLCWW